MKLSFVINAGPGYLRLSRKKRTFSVRGAGRKLPMSNPLFVTNAVLRYNSISPAQIQVAGIRQAAAAAPPVMKKKSCPSCGAPLVDEISDYCNVCGANIRRPAPLPPARETPRPAPERMGPAPHALAREPIQPSPVKNRARSPRLRTCLMRAKMFRDRKKAGDLS